MSDEVITAYVTKYALSGGIKKISAERSSYHPNLIFDKTTRLPVYFSGKEWHLTFDEARARAEEMRTAQLASLRKRIAKLEKLRFSL